MIKWTDKMINELLYTKNPNMIAKKYKIGYETSRRKLLELLGVKSIAELKEKEEMEKKIQEEKKEMELEKEQEEILKNNQKEVEGTEDNIVEEKTIECKIVNNIQKVIVDIDALKNKGINFYLTDSRKEIGNYDKQISDYRHALENSYDTLDDIELAQISRNIGSLSRKRRLFKNEMEFIDHHRTETQGFLDFLDLIDRESQKIDNKLYSTRILKEDIGHVVITSENNNMLKDLENENQELKKRLNDLERNPNPILPPDIKDRLYSLEKFNLKETRKRQREKGQDIAIDHLKQNWKELFNSELDDFTKNGIISDCYAKYTGVNVKEIRDLDVWGRIIPEYLYEKQYFLKEDDKN